MEYQYIKDTCSQCGEKSLVIIYPTAEDNIREIGGAANLFVWECPKCNVENKMPIAPVANAVNRD